MSDKKLFLLFLAVFLGFWFLPVDSLRFNSALHEAFALTSWYAREHVILCLIPAFFIAGAIATFVSQASVMKYLGAKANRALAYGVASVSGSILAVCSCTVLPLFAGIYSRGAGLGPATAFLYAGPAINVLAMILTARVLGLEMGIARAVGAVSFSIVIGVLMQFIFRKEDRDRTAEMLQLPAVETSRSLGQDIFYFAAMIGILVFANWGKPEAGDASFWSLVYASKWWITAAFGVLLAFILWRWFKKDEIKTWSASAWEYAKMILPLLFYGVLAAGFFLGRPGQEALIPNEWIASLVGGNSLWANFFASIVGAFMYFATLTEVPILEGLIGSGMGKGPALSLLLAGPALSLPSMLVIRGVLGTKKTVVYVSLVVVMATITGMAYGAIFE
ncbi:MAG: permease [Myxococcales bacterium]|nr:MAG: permease [Myxococcales bacterium]